MDLVHDKANNIDEEKEEENGEDRISNMSNDIILHILSFLDMKNAVQTCILSHRWEHVWKSTRDLNLSSRSFRTLPLFAKFVKNMISRRHNLEVYKVQLAFTGASTPYSVKSIIQYAILYKAKEFNMSWITKKYHQFPQCLFSFHTLKHLTLETGDQSFYLINNSCIPKTAWDFPVLETLFLGSMHFGDKGDVILDLFSKCVNLKDLTLRKCCFYGLHVFKIYALKLTDLTITEATSFPNVTEVIAPQLENLNAWIRGAIDRYPCKHDSFQLLDDLTSVKKVNLSLLMPFREQKRFVPLLFDLFYKLRSTKFLEINVDIIETLSLCLDEVSSEPCPFDNLECLKINAEPFNPKIHISTIPTQIKSYLLGNSPSATIIMDLPQVAQKRSSEEVHDETRAKKVAKSNPGKKKSKTSRFQSAELPSSSRASSSSSQKPTSSRVAGSGSNN